MIVHSYRDMLVSLPVLKSFLMPSLLLLVVLVLSYITYVLFLHPLAKIPGPKAAAITNWWSYYWEIGGKYPWKINKMAMDQNLDVIRVGPNRVAIHVSTEYDKIYRIGSKFMKDPEFYRYFPNVSASGGMTTTTATDKNTHARHRKLVSAKLSRTSILGLHDLIAGKIELLMQIYSDYAKRSEPVDIFAGWRTMTLDIISTFTFGHSMNGLEQPRLDHYMLNIMRSTLLILYPWIRLPLFARMLKSPIARYLVSDLSSMKEFKKWARECVEAYTPASDSNYLFDGLLNPPNKSQKMTEEEVAREGEEILVAGSDTTATTLTYACVYMSRNLETWDRVYQELLPVMRNKDDIPKLQDIEKLPYLTAVLKESLRLASPLPGYLWRIVPEGGYTVSNHFLPPGTSVGMSIAAVHYDPQLFPSPNKFLPDRWLGSTGAELDRFLIPFSKGTRSCAGINLAWMELYMALATLVRRFNIKPTPGPDKEMAQIEAFVGVLSADEWPISIEERQD